MNLKGKRVLVLGLGESGVSMSAWLAAQGASVRAADSRVSPPHADRLPGLLPGVALHLGGFPDDAFRDVDFIAISPGIPLTEPAVARARQRGIPVVGDVELFARAIAPAPRP